MMTVFVHTVPFQLCRDALLAYKNHLANFSQQGFCIMPSYRVYRKLHINSLMYFSITYHANISTEVPAGTKSNNSTISALRMRTQPFEPGWPKTVSSGV